MLDTTATTRIPAQQPLLDAFSADNTRAVHAAYERVFSLPSKLMSLRGLLSKLARAYVTEFAVHSDSERTSQHYLLTMGEYNVRVHLSSYASGANPGRRLSSRQSVLHMSHLLKKLHVDMRVHRTPEMQDAYSVVEHLVTRAFVLCSEAAAFECETHTNSWSVFFDDQRQRAQATLVVERRAV